MNKNKPRIKKNAQNHMIDVQSADHQLEMAEDFFPTLLDPEGTLADAYILHLKNENEKSGHF